MSTVAFDVAAVRARYSALDGPTAFFDGPGGTQVPDSVIEAMAGYLQESNANLGGSFSTSRESDRTVEEAHRAVARFLGASADEVGFGANMTTLNFTLSRTAARGWKPGDEVVVTRLDHDANVSPWLELAKDKDLVVRFVDVDDECRLDLDDLERQLSSRTRVVAYPWASNAVGTVTEVRRIADLVHEAGALVWVDAVHYAPHGPIHAEEAGVDVLLCSPYKFFGPHAGVFFGRREVLERWRPYKVRPAPDDPVSHRFETGTLAHEALAGTTAAVEYIEELGWDSIQAHERELGERFLDGLPDGVRIHGPAGLEGRVPTFALRVGDRRPAEVTEILAERDIAAWAGNYYALEIMQRLRLPEGAVRVGIVHYNTAEEVDRLLGELERLA